MNYLKHAICDSTPDQHRVIRSNFKMKWVS